MQWIFLQIMSKYMQIWKKKKNPPQHLMTVLSFLSLSNKTIDKSIVELTIFVNFNH